MFAGRVFKAERLQYRCRSAGSGGAVSDMFPMQLSHQASLRTFYTPDYVAKALGLAMSVRSSHWAVTGATQPDENPTHSASLTFPAIATDITISRDSWLEDLDSVLDIFGVSLYMNHNAAWELHVGDIEWRMNDELLGAWSGFTQYSTMTPTPLSIPIFPGAMDISAGAGVVVGTPTGVPLPSFTEGTMESTGHIGFRYMQDGVWKSPEIEFPEPYVIPGSPYNLDGILLGGNMWDGVIKCRSYQMWQYVYTETLNDYDLYRRDTITEGAAASATIIPNMAKTVERLNDDYAAEIFRGGFPRVTEAARLVDLVFRPGYPPGGTHGGGLWIFAEEREKLQSHPMFLATVQNDPHVIEDPMNESTLSGAGISRTYFDFTRWREIAAPAGSTEWFWEGGPPQPGWVNPTQITRKNGGVYYTFPNAVQNVGDSVLPYLTHFEPIVMYLNTWANPHWSYMMYFATEGAADSIQWKIDNVPVTPQELWLNARQQFIDHPALPEPERLRIRNHIITEPLAQNGLAGLMLNQVYGQITSFWGISRHHVQRFDPTENIALDARSAPAWTTSDGTLSIDASGVHVTPDAGKSIIKVDLDVGRFSEHPYMIPHIADEFTVDWSGAHVESGVVKQIGIDGGIVEFTDVPIRKPKQLGMAKKYAGTWVIDYGVGYLDDAGVDLYDPASKSMSASVMGSPEGVFAFRMLPARGFDKLRFEIQIQSEPSPPVIDIDFPVFHNTWAAPDLAVVRESAIFTSIFTPDGPHWRYGTWTFYNVLLGLLDPPFVADAFGMPTALDWLCSRRLMVDGVSPFEGIFAEIGTIYDLNIEWTQTKHLAADPFTESPVTHSFIFQGSSKLMGVMVNSYSEVPPLAGFPNQERNGDHEITGGYAQTAYSLVTTKQWVIHPGQTGDPINRFLKPPIVPENDRLIPATIVDGYLGGYHREIVDGMEALEWRIRRLYGAHDVDWARMRPWHGYVWIPGDSVQTGLFAMDMCRDDQLGFLHAAIPNTDGVLLWSWDETKGTERERMIVADDCRSAGIAWSRGTRLIVVVFDSNQPDGSVTIKRTESDSQGLTWSDPEMLWEGKGSRPAFDAIGREFISYWHDGAFRIRYRKAEAQTWAGPFTIVESATEGVTSVEIAPWADAPVVVITNVELDDGSREIRRFESTSFGRTWRETT